MLSYIQQSLQLNHFFSLSLYWNAFIKVDHSSFDLHAQQEDVEVLEIVLEEFTDPSIVTSTSYNIKSLTSIIHMPTLSSI